MLVFQAFRVEFEPDRVRGEPTFTVISGM